MPDPRPDTRERAVEAAAMRADPSGIDVPGTSRVAEQMTDAAVPVVLDDIEALIEQDGRDAVKWLAKHASDSVDRARLIGAEDAYRDVLRRLRAWRARNGWSRD